jgi:hypothetical protein
MTDDVLQSLDLGPITRERLTTTKAVGDPDHEPPDLRLRQIEPCKADDFCKRVGHGSSTIEHTFGRP